MRCCVIDKGLGVATSGTAILSFVNLLHHDERDRVQAARVFGTAIGMTSSIALRAALYKNLVFLAICLLFSAFLPIAYFE